MYRGMEAPDIRMGAAISSHHTTPERGGRDPLPGTARYGSGKTNGDTRRGLCGSIAMIL